MNSNGKFENIEYIQVSKNKKVLKTYKAEEINGLTKAQFQEVLGRDFGQIRLGLSINKKNEFTNRSMQLRGIILDEKEQKEMKQKELNNNSNDEVFTSINNLKKKIETLSEDKQSYSYDAVIEMIKQSYQIRFEALQERIDYLKNEIIEYKKYINELEKENNSKGVDVQGMLATMMQLKGAIGLKKKSSFADENKNINSKSEIPDLVLKSLNNVDYKKLDNKKIEEYANLLSKFAKNLPQKEE